MGLGDYLADDGHSERPAEYHELGVITQASPLLVAVGADSVGRPVSAHMVNGVVGDRVLVLVQGACRTVLANLTVAPTWHSVGAAGEPAFQNGWTNFGGGFAPARFQRVGDRVWIEGLIKDGTMPGTAFTLPDGFRPTGGARLFGVHTGGLEGRVDVHLNGNVHVQSSNTGYVELNVSFPID